MGNNPIPPPLDYEDLQLHKIREAYAHGEFGPDELEWRILVALKPPGLLPFPHPSRRAADFDIADHYRALRPARPLIPRNSAPQDPEERERFADAEWARIHDAYG